MSEHHYQELCRLKGLTSLPSVQNVLERLINEQHAAREPIKRSKVLSIFSFLKSRFNSTIIFHIIQAQVQTLYITTGYAWGQSLATVT